MRDHREKPPWWETTVRDHPDERPPRFEDHLFRHISLHISMQVSSWARTNPPLVFRPLLFDFVGGLKRGVPLYCLHLHLLLQLGFLSLYDCCDGSENANLSGEIHRHIATWTLFSHCFHTLCCMYFCCTISGFHWCFCSTSFTSFWRAHWKPQHMYKYFFLNERKKTTFFGVELYLLCRGIHMNDASLRNEQCSCIHPSGRFALSKNCYAGFFSKHYLGEIFKM